MNSDTAILDIITDVRNMFYIEVLTFPPNSRLIKQSRNGGDFAKN